MTEANGSDDRISKAEVAGASAGLMDAQPMRIAKATDATVEIGASGLLALGGYVREEYLPVLQGDRALRTWKEMIDDPTCGGILFASDILQRQVEWWAEPDDQDPDGQASADFLLECLGDMSYTWEDTLSEILTFLPYGWAFHEIVYKVRGGDTADPRTRSKFTDGMLGWRKLALRAQETRWRWEFQPAEQGGGISGMWQISPPSYVPVFIPMEKALLFRTMANRGNPEGRSIFRTAYRPWFFKKRTEEVEGIGLERDLAGLPVITAPARMFSTDASANDQMVLNSLKQIVRNLRIDEQMGVVMPADFDAHGNNLYELKLLTTLSRKQFDTGAVVNRYKVDIMQSVLADFLQLGQQQVGSFALGSSKIELFAAALGAWLDAIADVFNTYAIPRLWKLNGKDPGLAPKLMHSDVKQVDFDQITLGLQQLAASGAPIWPNAKLLMFLLNLANLPADETASEQQ